MEKYVGWKAHLSPEHENWAKLVRDRRNDAVHEGPTPLSAMDVEMAWDAACSSISSSNRECIQALMAKGMQISNHNAAPFYTPLSRQLFSPGLIGDHSRTD